MRNIEQQFVRVHVRHLIWVVREDQLICLNVYMRFVRCKRGLKLDLKVKCVWLAQLQLSSVELSGERWTWFNSSKVLITLIEPKFCNQLSQMISIKSIILHRNVHKMSSTNMSKWSRCLFS